MHTYVSNADTVCSNISIFKYYLKLLESNEKVLGLIGDIIIDAAGGKEEYKHPKKDYKIKFNLPATW